MEIKLEAFAAPSTPEHISKRGVDVADLGATLELALTKATCGVPSLSIDRRYATKPIALLVRGR